jgi:hypothetical protein
MAAMCERCVELDQKIDLYRQLSSWVFEKETIRGIETLIQRYQVDKQMLHPSGNAQVGKRVLHPPRNASLHEPGSDATQIEGAARSPRMCDDPRPQHGERVIKDHASGLRQMLYKLGKRLN